MSEAGVHVKYRCLPTDCLDSLTLMSVAGVASLLLVLMATNRDPGNGASPDIGQTLGALDFDGADFGGVAVDLQNPGTILVAAEKLTCESFEVAVPLRVYGAVTTGLERLERDHASEQGLPV